MRTEGYNYVLFHYYSINRMKFNAKMLVNTETGKGLHYRMTKNRFFLSQKENIS